MDYSTCIMLHVYICSIFHFISTTIKSQYTSAKLSPHRSERPQFSSWEGHKIICMELSNVAFLLVLQTISTCAPLTRSLVNTKIY